MANTEGMSDETMASLLSPDAGMMKPKKSSVFSQSRMMQQRLEQPMGAKPAATVVRVGRCQVQTSQKSTTYTPSHEQEERIETQDEEQSSSEPALPPILGSIVERDVSAATVQPCGTATGEARPRSHFATGRLQSDHGKGFPSVHVPVGTFVRRQPNVQKASATAKLSKQQSPLQETTPLTTTADSIRDTSQRDAENMLAQMTPDEIQEEVHELQAALSPETIAFLKNRGRQRSSQKKTSTDISSGRNRNLMQLSEKAALQTVEETEEKKRLASVVSSIRTYADLDAAYNREIGAENGKDVPAKDNWTTACSLLRSTSPRQTLWAARVVCQHLEKDVLDCKSFPVATTWPYPSILVVSLRCLLDAPVSQTSMLVLHTYVLRSIYALLRLRAPIDHVVDVQGWGSKTVSSIYQEYFMDDAVPTPPFGTCYPSFSAEPLASTKDGDAVAYSTSSSSTSAEEDGDAFAKDPMWTLLTRMRILPRLATLLSVTHTTNALSDEAIVAMCGILAMLSVRSIGAASAIAQHAVLLPSLLKMTVLPPTDKDDSHCARLYNARIALPAIRFLCALARQSRLAASAIPIDEILPPILAMDVETDEEHKLQQSSLVLWRTMLRYGFGLQIISTCISLSIPNLAGERPVLKHPLAVEFLSAFTNICHCARIAKCKPEMEWDRIMTRSDGDAISTAMTWLATSFRQTLQHTEGMASSFSDFNWVDLRIGAARLRYVQSFVSAYEQDGASSPDDGKWEDDETIDFSVVIAAVGKMIETGVVDKALDMVSPVSTDCATRDTTDGWVDVISFEQEAVASAFVGSVASILSTICRAVARRKRKTESSLHKQFETLSATLRSSFINWMTCTQGIHTFHAPESLPRPRRGWLNMMNFQISRFLLPETLLDVSVEIDDFAIIRSHVFSLIGQLQRGEEATAAILCSNDVLFRFGANAGLSASSLSSFLMSELCSTPLSRQQLDHSFKLQFGFGITAEEWGPFESRTLLSEIDNQALRGSDLLLPAGPLWLPKIISGTSLRPQLDHDVVLDELHDEITVVSSCLCLLLQLEDEKSESSFSYVAQLPNGAKLYYLLNVFLHSESAIRDDLIHGLVIRLFDCYTEELQSRVNNLTGPAFASSFSKACFDHSRVANSHQAMSVSESGMVAEEKKLLSVLIGDIEVSKAEIQSLVDFVSDVAKAYLEFGAQYEAFTKCIRVFFSVCFPAEVRCEAIRTLKEVLHIMTLRSEEVDELRAALDMCLVGGTLGTEHATGDPPEVLDLIVFVMADGGVVPVNESRWSPWSGNFFFVFAIGSLARSLKASNGEAAIRRLSALAPETTSLVVETASRLQGKEDEWIQHLVETTMDLLDEKMASLLG